MTDLSETIAAKSDQLTADDLLGGPMTVKVTKVSHGSAEQPIAINFDGDNGKPYYPCKIMRRVLVEVWGKDGNTYVDRGLTLFRDPKVAFGGIQCGGIRISHMSHIDEARTLSLQMSKAVRKPHRVMPLKPAGTAAAKAPAATSAPAAAPAADAAKRKTWPEAIAEIQARLEAVEAGDARTLGGILAEQQTVDMLAKAQNGNKAKLEEMVAAAKARVLVDEPGPDDGGTVEEDPGYWDRP